VRISAHQFIVGVALVAVGWSLANLTRTTQTASISPSSLSTGIIENVVEPVAIPTWIATGVEEGTGEVFPATTFSAPERIHDSEGLLRVDVRYRGMILPTPEWIRDKLWPLTVQVMEGCEIEHQPAPFVIAMSR
jgi:hypothetical protein